MGAHLFLLSKAAPDCSEEMWRRVVGMPGRSSSFIIQEFGCWVIGVSGHNVCSRPVMGAECYSSL